MGRCAASYAGAGGQHRKVESCILGGGGDEVGGWVDGWASVEGVWKAFVARDKRDIWVHAWMGSAEVPRSAFASSMVAGTQTPYNFWRETCCRTFSFRDPIKRSEVRRVLYSGSMQARYNLPLFHCSGHGCFVPHRSSSLAHFQLRARTVITDIAAEKVIDSNAIKQMLHD